MNHRERVLSAIRRQPVERLPFDFWAEPATIENLYTHFGTHDIEEILVNFDVDIRHVKAIEPEEKDCGGYVENMWGERYIYRDTVWGKLREDIPGALSDAKDISDLENFPWPDVNRNDYSHLKAECESHAGCAIQYGWADVWQRPCLVRGFENALMDLYANPDWVHYLGRTFTDYYRQDYQMAQEACGGKIDIFLVISDVGTQTGPLISMEMFDEFVAPYIKEMTDCIHDLDASAMFHSCGMIEPFIERFINLGVDIIDPIQPVSDNMSPEFLKQKYGDRVSFHGGIDVQGVLVSATPDEVKAVVRRYLDVFSETGYICCPSHFFQPDTPGENIQAFYDTLRG